MKLAASITLITQVILTFFIGVSELTPLINL